MVCRASRAPFTLPGALEGVERHPDGPIADGVDVDLPALAVQRLDQAVEPGLGIGRLAGVTLAIEVGLEQRGGARLDDAVLEELRGDGPDPRSRIPSRASPQPTHQPLDAGGVRLGIAAATMRTVSLPVAVRLGVGAEVALGARRLRTRT